MERVGFWVQSQVLVASGQVLAFAKAEFQLTLSVEVGGPWRLLRKKGEGALT